MGRSVLVGALLVAIGAAAASFVVWWQAPLDAARLDQHTATAGVPSAGGFGAVGARADGGRQRADVEQRLARLEARVAEEAAERQRLQERFDAVAAQLAGRDGGDEPEGGRSSSSLPSATAETPADDPANAIASDDSKSAMERALAAGGLDAATAADIKRRHDALAMTEMYLRDQATREEWLDSPRFAEEMSAIESQRTSIRDEIGDDAYDRYLFALGEPNRVRVDDVLLQSPAAQAGLQAGDVIVRYGDARIFAPGELVAQTRDGTAGEPIRLEIIRNGERLEVEVPRGPLGLRIAATQSMPDAS